MGKTKKLGDLVNVVVTDNDGNVSLPKALTLGEAPLLTDDSLKAPTTSWVNDKLEDKVDKVAGKDLSTNDFTNTLKTKLDGIEVGAEVNVNADWNAVSGDAQILNKPSIQPQLNGLGFVKANGTTISYDNSTYLTTISGITAGGELTGTYPNPTLVTSAVTSKLLSGVNITGGSITATDSILTAFGKLQNQVNGVIGGSTYQGTWNASTNTPNLVSSTGTNGYYYIVSVDGSTNLNGITDWKVGDWAIFNGGAWQKVDNTDAVVSVNGFTGAVSLTTSNITEGTNLYFTNARARAAISLTTSGTSGAATYDNGTGVLNIPNYGSALSGYLPLTGGTLASSGSINTLNINHTSGSGIALNISKNGNGEALTIVKGSGSGNAASITGGITLLSELNLTTKLADAHIASAATWNAKQNALNGTGFVKISGTTISYDNSSYALESSLGSYLPLAGGTLTGALGGTSATFSGAVQSTSFNGFDNISLVAQNINTNGTVLTLNSAGTIGTIKLQTNSTDRLTLTSAGNVLIGTTTDAGYKLDVNGTGRFGGALTGTSATFSGNVGIGTTSPAYSLDVNGAVNVSVNNFIRYNGDTGIFGSATSITGGSNTQLGIRASSDILFATNGATERMRITSSGNLLIGTTTDAGFKLDVNGTGRFSGALTGTSATFSSTANSVINIDTFPTTAGESGLRITDSTRLTILARTGSAYTYRGVPANSGFLYSNTRIAFLADNPGAGFTFHTGDSSQILSLASTGAATFSSSVTATGFFVSSDITLKSLTQDTFNASKIDAISYKWKTDLQGKTLVGYSAQEVQKYMPDAVNTDSNGKLSVDYIQVLVQKIAHLENKLKEHGLE